VWKVFPPPASAAGDDGAVEEQRKAWRAEVVGEWGKGDVTVGKVEVGVVFSRLYVPG
jgi:hypothetical protein